MKRALSPATARLMILVVALLFSTGGAAIKATTLTGWQVAGLRSAVAAIAVFLFMPAARRGWSARSAIVGLAYAATLICFVTSNKLTTAANSIFLQSTSPLYMLLLGPWLLRERITRREIAYIAALAAGMLLLFAGAHGRFATAPDPARGNAIAAVSGLTWAFTVTGLRWIAAGKGGKPGSPMTAVVAGNVIALFVCLPMMGTPPDPALGAPAGNVSGSLIGSIAAVTATDWAVIVYLGVFQIGLAYVLLSVAIHHVPAFEASLLLLLEPVLNPVWAWMVQGERPGPYALAGGAIILAVTALRTLRSRRAGGGHSSPR